MIVPTAGLIAVLGTSAVLVLLIGIWYPAYARTRMLRRRLGLLVGTTGSAVDLGGRRRSRGPRRPALDGHSGLLRGLEGRLERAALDITAGEVVGAMVVLAGASALIAGVLWGPLPAVAGIEPRSGRDGGARPDPGGQPLAGHSRDASSADR